jgi:hypothetical protein
MGIGIFDKQAQAIVDDIAKDNCPTADAAVDDFNKAIKEQRGRGDFDKLASDSTSEGDTQRRESGRALNAGDSEGMESAARCAAANTEVAGADTLKVKGFQWSDNAQRICENAGKDRTHAGEAAASIGDEKLKAAEKAKNSNDYGEAAKNYGEAAKNYGEAARNHKKGQADFKLADYLATRAGNNGDAVDYYVKGNDAGKNAGEKYGEAGKNYGEAARLATKAGNKHDADDYHKKAAENYGEAAKTYGELAESATKAHNKHDADNYQVKAKEAREAAEEEKAASAAHNTPKK